MASQTPTPALIFLRQHSQTPSTYLYLRSDDPIQKAIEENKDFEITKDHPKWHVCMGAFSAHGVLTVVELDVEGDSAHWRPKAAKNYVIKIDQNNNVLGYYEGGSIPIVDCPWLVGTDEHGPMMSIGMESAQPVCPPIVLSDLSRTAKERWMSYVQARLSEASDGPESAKEGLEAMSLD